MSTVKETKKENIWNSILSETGERKKFTNKQVLLLGSKGSGKRTLIDQLHEKQHVLLEQNDIQSGKLRIAGSVSALDYVYLNVKNLEEVEEDTMAKLNVYLLDDCNHNDLLPIVLKQSTVLDTAIVIVLDLTEPWTFMEQADKWIEVITKQLQNLQLNLDLLDQMRSKSNIGLLTYQKQIHFHFSTFEVDKLVRDYKEPQADSDGKIISSAEARRIQKEEDPEVKRIKVRYEKQLEA